MKKNIEKFLLTKNYKEISLYGFIYMFFIVVALACFVDVLSENYSDATVECVAVLIDYSLLYYLKKSQKIELVSIILVWLSAIAVFVLVYINDFYHSSYLFLFFAPFAFYLVLDKNRLLRHALLYYFFMIAFLVYAYYYSSNRLLFDDSIALGAIFIGIVFDIAIGIFIYYSIQYSFDKLETSNREKEFLLKEIHHRVKNNLNMISSILGLQETYNDKKIEQIITRNRDRIQAIATVHEMLYQHDSLANVNCSEYINTLTKEILRSYSYDDIKLNLHVDDFSIFLENMIHFGLMIQEMFINSIKHADSPNLTVTIIIQKNGENISFEYFDNGVGCDVQMLKESHSLGYDLIQFSAKKLHADISILNKSGLHYHLEFKDV